jgi:hypothetical protein
MILRTQSPPIVLAEFRSEELAVFNNCLNEVVNGFGVRGQEQRLGASPDQVSALLLMIHQAAVSERSFAIHVSIADLLTLVRAVRFALSELGDEFSIRTGFSPEEASAVTREVERRVANL